MLAPWARYTVQPFLGRKTMTWPAQAMPGAGKVWAGRAGRQSAEQVQGSVGQRRYKGYMERTEGYPVSRNLDHAVWTLASGGACSINARAPCAAPPPAVPVPTGAAAPAASPRAIVHG